VISGVPESLSLTSPDEKLLASFKKKIAGSTRTNGFPSATENLSAVAGRASSYTARFSVISLSSRIAPIESWSFHRAGRLHCMIASDKASRIKEEKINIEKNKGHSVHSQNLGF